MAGMSVSDVSQKAIANLGWREIKLTHPVFVGDTLSAESEVLDKRESKSRPQAGIVTVKTRGFNQQGTLVCEFDRTILVGKRGFDTEKGGYYADSSVKPTQERRRRRGRGGRVVQPLQGIRVLTHSNNTGPGRTARCTWPIWVPRSSRSRHRRGPAWRRATARGMRGRSSLAPTTASSSKASIAASAAWCSICTTRRAMRRS